MNTLSQILCFCGAMTIGPHAQPVQSAGFIQYRYEALSSNVYLLRLSTPDLFFDTDEWRQDRMHAFAQQFADQACHGRFQLAKADATNWPKVRPLYTGQFVFRCR